MRARPRINEADPLTPARESSGVRVAMVAYHWVASTLTTAGAKRRCIGIRRIGGVA